VHKDFPGDSGVFCLLLLNVVELAPGEALYLAPNEPHAYFEGDCVECMANSDNVVRAGLTPKFKHVDTLIEMLTYRSEEPIDILHGENRDCELVYAPPIPEFQIGRIDVVPGETKEPRSSKAVSILIAIAGQGSLTDNASGDTFDLLPGASFFLAANASFKVTCHTDRLILYRATVSGGL
jgi:mannose-6-phosphate isomerase